MGPELFLGALLLVAAGWDLAWRRIPNALVLLGLTLGLAGGLLAGGVGGLLLGLAGAGLAFAICFPQWALGWMGGGDAKLFMAIGATLGPWRLVDVLIYATALNGLLALGMVALRAAGRARGRPFVKDERLPMAVAMALGHALVAARPLLSA